MAGKKKAAPGEIGHNSGAPTPLTDDEMYALTLQHKKKYEHALAAKKTADAALKHICKVLKSDLGDAGLKDIKDMIAAEEDGFDEKFLAELERKARLARWIGMDLGRQADLFDFGAVKPGVSERAYNDGKRAGLAGEVCKPPFDGGSEGHNEYVRGWHDGQASNLSLIKKKEAEEVPLIVKADREASGVDEFDEAAAGGDDEIETAAGTDGDDGEPWPDDVSVAAKAGEDIREPAETL